MDGFETTQIVWVFVAAVVSLVGVGLGVLSHRFRTQGKPIAASILAGLSGLCLVGAAQGANGQWVKGVVLFVLSFALWWVLLGWVVQLYGAVDGAVVSYRLTHAEEPA